MRKLSKILFVLFITGLTTIITSQNLALNDKSVKLNIPQKNIVIKKVLDNGSYFYSCCTEKILVEINGNSYTEYHPNNEFIKAKITWVTNNSYKLIITEIKKAGLPFKKGTELKTEILKIKGQKYSYKSTLNTHSWTGKLNKIIE